jgi:26S proteasome regulatory subunit N7
MSKRHNGISLGRVDVRLIDSGGDWDRRNRLKAYQGIYLLSIRSFAPAADLLLDVLSTFTSTELMEFEDVVMYAVLAGSISLSRVDLKTKVPLPGQHS